MGCIGMATFVDLVQLQGAGSHLKLTLHSGF